MVVELRSANWTVLAATLNELDNAKPMEGMIAGQSPRLRHRFFAYRAFFLLLMILHKRVVDVDVPEEPSEIYEFVDFLVEILS